MPTPETGHWLGTVKVGMGGLVPCLWQVNKGWGLLWFWDQVGSAGKEAVGVDSDTVEVCQSTTRPGHTRSAVIPWSWVDRTLKEHVVPCIYILIFILTDILIRYHYSNFPFYSFMPSRQVIKSCIWFMVPRQCSISKYCLTKAALYDPVCLG